MPRLFVTLSLLALLALTSGCAQVGISNPFTSESTPGQSELLGITLPAGMERSATHSRPTEGLEVAMGYVNANSVAQSIFNSLQGSGWQLRLQQMRNGRGLFLYERGPQSAMVSVNSQSVQTILYIVAGSRLPDGSSLNLAVPAESSGESDGGWGSSTPDSTPAPSGGSGWGSGSSGGLQERSL